MDILILHTNTLNNQKQFSSLNQFKYLREIVGIAKEYSRNW